jgi:anti-anti-sigma regulatory factor
MTLMIQITSLEKISIFALSGRIRGEDVTALEQLIEPVAENRNIVLDLKEVRLVDRDVVKFLAQSESHGAKLENCPLYVRDWIIGASCQ